METKRVIGIVHRVKQTAEQESHPTMLCVMAEKKVCHSLETETDELDFLLGRFPIKFRKVVPTDNLSKFKPHQIKWKKVTDEADFDAVADIQGNERIVNPQFIKKDGKLTYVADKVPIAFDGLHAGDTVVMCLGGSGDRFAYALARHGQDIGAEVYRLAPKHLKANRVNDDKSHDHELLVRIYLENSELFQEATPAELSLIRIRELFDQRMDSMKARIECEQRLCQRLVGKIFLNTEGKYPEGAVEDMFDAEKANDKILQSLIAEEESRNRELSKEVSAHPLFVAVFDDIEGFGIRIAAPLIAFIGNILRFESVASFKQYCGVAPDATGHFQRKRRDSAMRYRPEIRQALFLFADQMNRRPNSTWGRVFMEEKTRLRAKYPDEVIENRPDPKNLEKIKSVKMYTNGHIHNKARWHALGRFCEWLYGEWTKAIELLAEVEKKVA
ncbi:MAG: transposase [bacterium]